MDNYLKLMSEIGYEKTELEHQMNDSKKSLNAIINSIKDERGILDYEKEEEERLLGVKKVLDNYDSILKGFRADARKRGFAFWTKLEVLFSMMFLGAFLFHGIPFEALCKLIFMFGAIFGVISTGYGMFYYNELSKKTKRIKKQNRLSDIEEGLGKAKSKIKSVQENINKMLKEKESMKSQISVLEEAINALNEKIIYVKGRRNKVLGIPAIETVLNAFYHEDKGIMLLRQKGDVSYNG